MEYQYLRHDGFYYRRPPVSEEKWYDSSEIEIWNGRKWMTPLSTDDAMLPTHYGIEVPEAVALQQVDADKARYGVES